MKQEHKIFVAEMVKHGIENKAVVKAYPHLKGDNKKIRTYSGRLLKNVEIVQVIQQKATKIAAVATQEAITDLKEEIKADILTATLKRSLLYQIVSIGEVEDVIKKQYFDEEQQKFVYKEIPIKRRATILERLKAIELDNKMSGDNAPTKTAFTDKEGNNIRPIIQLMPAPGCEPMKEV